VRTWVAVAIVAVALFFVSNGARAQGLIEQLVMPGPLVGNHAKWEGECTKCHEPFSRKAQTALCLDCHKDVAADRERREGFHGRHPEARARDCVGCHTEHKGRAADISNLDRERFDHGATNYPLTDAHKKVDCAGCHEPNKSYRKTPTQCADCHGKIDPHKGRLGDKCADCHAPTAWRNVKPFDHGNTRFPLEGAHKDVACKTCHAGELYKDLAKDCISCHRIQDVHGGRYGVKCETCHDTTRWKDVTFDHSKTRFPLHGAHASVRCDACHTGELYAEKLGTDCVSCHRAQDPHKGQLGDKCERCHNDQDWQRNINFNHNKTKFPLVGAHATALCEACHVSKKFTGAPTLCARCHEDSYHKGRLGAASQCGQCHDSVDWKRWRFDHSRQANYPLTGAHVKLVCEKCHANPNPPTLRLATACIACHKDFHQSYLGVDPKCEACHNTVAWPQWRFDHRKLTGFPLIGGHVPLTCEKCHNVKGATTLKIATTCVSCHKKDNPHGMAFGLACERCHDAINWRHLTLPP